MVTRLLQAAVYDLVQMQKSGKKDEVMPKALLAVLDHAKFDADVSALVPLIANAHSVFDELPRVKGNVVFDAFLDALIEDLPQLLQLKKGDGAFLSRMEDIGAQQRFREVLVREAQDLLFEARGVDSPRIQLAAEIDEALKDELIGKTNHGIPSIKVNPGLIGGMRRFQDGKLMDLSWKSRLTRLLKKVS